MKLISYSGVRYKKTDPDNYKRTFSLYTLLATKKEQLIESSNLTKCPVNLTKILEMTKEVNVRYQRLKEKCLGIFRFFEKSSVVARSLELCSIMAIGSPPITNGKKEESTPILIQKGQQNYFKIGPYCY
ncbi:hypothetical protein SFRURICE_010832, partial [Spodoptera frugiperda]